MRSASDDAAGLLIYDADCGFCTASAQWFERIAARPDVIAPWQALELADLGLNSEQVGQAVQWHADDRNWSGADACSQALLTCPQPWRSLGRLLALPGVRSIARLIYPVIARNRHRLPGGTSSCKL